MAGSVFTTWTMRVRLRMRKIRRPTRHGRTPVRSESVSFDQALRAFKLAAPFAMAVRTEDFAHCVEASLVGAQSLRALKIDARAIPCCVVGENVTLEPVVQLSLGLSEQDVYDRIAWGDEPPLSFAEWKTVTGGAPLVEGKPPIHMAIAAHAKHRRVILDPTLGQLRAAHQVDVAVAEYFECEPGQRWVAFATRGGWELQYEDSPHAEAIEKHAAGYEVPRDWVEDLTDLMRLAIACDLNDDAFFASLRTQQPDAFRLAEKRIMKIAHRAG